MALFSLKEAKIYYPSRYSKKNNAKGFDLTVIFCLIYSLLHDIFIVCVIAQWRSKMCWNLLHRHRLPRSWRLFNINYHELLHSVGLGLSLPFNFLIALLLMKWFMGLLSISQSLGMMAVDMASDQGVKNLILVTSFIIIKLILV